MLNQPIAKQTLLISLKSWRYIIFVSLLAYLIGTVSLLHLQSPWFIAFSYLVGFITLFFCWRLWLDEMFFVLLDRYPDNTVEFDAAIQSLWSKNQTSRTMEERYQGTAKLIYRAWLAVFIQWVIVIIATVSMNLQ